MSQNRSAEHIVWDAPGGVQMSLTPEPGGSLDVEVDGGAVKVTGRRCRQTQGEDAKNPSQTAHQVLSEVSLTILSLRCQITWKCVVSPEQKKK